MSANTVTFQDRFGNIHYVHGNEINALKEYFGTTIIPFMKENDKLLAAYSETQRWSRISWNGSSWTWQCLGYNPGMVWGSHKGTTITCEDWRTLLHNIAAWNPNCEACHKNGLDPIYSKADSTKLKNA